MAKYRVLKYFTDLQDNDYAYHAGDLFPREGLAVAEERLTELSTNQNKRGTPLIEAVEEALAAKVEEPEEPEPIPAAEKKPATKQRGRKAKGKE